MMLTLARFIAALPFAFVWLVVLGPKTREEAWRYYDIMVGT